MYDLTRNYPADERYGLVAQLRRAAISVMSNIAEGSKRITQRDYAHFLNIAEGSAAEIESLLITSTDQAYLDTESADEAIYAVDEISRMLFALRRSVLSRTNAP